MLAHGGGYLPAYSGRIDHAASARPDTCEQLKEMPTTYLQAAVFRLAGLHPPPAANTWCEQYGADHILVGTDYPADMGEIDPIGFIETAPGLDDAERARDPRRQRRAAAGDCGAVRRDRDCFVAALLAMTGGGVSC